MLGNMPSVGHAMVGLAASAGTPAPRPGRALLLAGLALLPDADGIAFLLGVPYGATWGHRGASHSLAFAAAAGALVAGLGPQLAGSRVRTFLLATAVVASHGLLDAFT